MITAVDTNILLDVFGADASFGRASANALRLCCAAGAVVACEIVWAETAAAFPEEALFVDAMTTLGIGFQAIGREVAILAGAVWRSYRQRGGKRERVVADFLIGAHALSRCDRLLSRDRGFYRSYFENLEVLDPSTASL
jgi:predicted nucleic acid-binding protein